MIYHYVTNYLTIHPSIYLSVCLSIYLTTYHSVLSILFYPILLCSVLFLTGIFLILTLTLILVLILILVLSCFRYSPTSETKQFFETKLTLSCQYAPMPFFAIFPSVLRLRRKSGARSHEVLHLSQNVTKSS